jgi:hypothetical protein
MAINDRISSEGSSQPAATGTRLFVIRLWKEEAAEGFEFRGSARDVVNGSFVGFRDWTDLTAFMAARVEEDEFARFSGIEGALA